MGDLFLWLKVGHILSFVSWMAGLFYLPRLFVYHTRFVVGDAGYELFGLMEGRLLKAIMTPAAVATWIFGGLLVVAGGYLSAMPGWLWLKIGVVLGLSCFHAFLWRVWRQFCRGENQRPERFYRIINEVPTLLLIGIVVLVVVRPFE